MRSIEYPDIGETLYEDRLENGLRIFVVPKPGFSTSFAGFAVDYGGAYRDFTADGKEVHTPAGIAHFLEHKMFDMPDGDSAINLLCANGADPNAFTDFDMTFYYFSCTKNFYDNLKLLLKFVSTPYFTPETVQKEQGIIGQEIRMVEDEPGQAVFYNLMKLLFPGHPISCEIAGTVESIAGISDKTLYDCYGTFYRPSNMILCVVGDVDPEEVIKTADRELSPEFRSAPEPVLPDKTDFIPEKKLVREYMEVSAPQFMAGAGFRPAEAGKRLMRQELIARLSMRLLAGSSSPLYLKLYSDGLIDRSFDYDCDYSANMAFVSIGGESPDPEKVLEAFSAEAVRTVREGIDPECFERAKRATLGAKLRGFEDFGSVCASMAACGFDGYRTFDTPAELADIKISDCEAFIREVLDPDRLAISIIETKRS